MWEGLRTRSSTMLEVRARVALGRVPQGTGLPTRYE